MERELFDVEYDFKSILLEERKNKIFERSEKMLFNEEYHTKEKPEWIVDLYLELDKFIMSLKSQGIKKEYLESYIKYSFFGLLFVYIRLHKRETLKVWAKIPYASLGAVPLFVRDYEPVSRRVGVLISIDDRREFIASKEAMLDVIFGIIKKALQVVASRKGRKKTPLEAIKKREVELVKPTEVFKPSLNLVIDNNGYIDVSFKIKKSQRELLNRILQETILK